MREHTRNQKRMYRIHKQEEKILEQELMITSLQQKVEQLEKENKELNRFCELYVQSLYNADLTKAEKKVEQLENIRKEVIEYIKDNACYSEGHCKCSFSQIALDNLLNILNKGENNE